MIIFESYYDASWSFFIDNFITLFFILSMFFVYFKYRNERSLKIGVTVYAISYILSNLAYGMVETLPSGELVGPDFFYLQWVMYESLTIILSFMIHLTIKTQHNEAVINAYRLSCINMVSCLAMHYLAIETSTPDHWFYPIYSSIINLTALMINVLFILNLKWNFTECFSKYRLL